MTTALVVVIVLNIMFDIMVLSLLSSKTGYSKARTRILYHKFKQIEQSFWLCKQMLDHQEILLRQQAGPGGSVRTQWDTFKK